MSVDGVAAIDGPNARGSQASAKRRASAAAGQLLGEAQFDSASVRVRFPIALVQQPESSRERHLFLGAEAD